VPEVSHVADARPTAEPLTAAEVAEMKQHLAFLRTYKDLLRLKLNAAEDLLVNGRREPTERGTCRHLLAKVERAAIEGAIGREPLRSDAAARARMLAGAVRLTADVGVLLAYLEALAQVRSRAEAAAAFAQVVARIDFESLSPTRLARLLQVLLDTFTGYERVQVLFGLLATPPFLRAFDAAAPAFPPQVAEAFAPLRAVHRRLVEGADDAPDPALLATGVEQLLSAPDPVLRAYDAPLRVRLLELTLGPDVPAALADRAAGVLLPSLPRDDRAYARLALRRAASLLARHADDRARALLEEVLRARPGLDVAQRWLGALRARRLGRIALAGGPPATGRLAPAFWLDGRRPVWLRTAPAASAEGLAAEARLQADLALPGLAPVVEHGVASGIPYVAVAGPGAPLAAAALSSLDLATSLALAAAAARILRALALAAVVLPDAEPERFLQCARGDPALVLADLDGARRTEAGAAAGIHAAHGTALARRLLAAHAPRLPDELRDALEPTAGGVGSLPALVAALDRAWLQASPG
jgi:hypothetical protein